MGSDSVSVAPGPDQDQIRTRPGAVQSQLMDQVYSRGSGLDQSPAGGAQAFDRCPPQQQFVSPTSRGRHSASHCHTAVSVHPLVPLLLYSHRLFPPAPGNSQPTTAAAAPQGHAHNTDYQGNKTARQQVKKPLNAFMLYMKEMRHKVLQEGRERESAAINRILGRRWHGLTQSEQSKYYELAQKERLLHMQLYPGWSARDNYGKKKKRRSQQPSSNHRPSSGLLL